ncbi:unnamed protein product [Absidia cylindrospora]
MIFLLMIYRNYCTSTDQGVQSCSHPQAGYNWINTPNVNQVISSARYSSGLFLGLFILLIIGLCLTFLLLIASLPLCCVRARSVGASMSALIFLTFLVMLAALIIELVVVIRGNQLLHQADPSWTGRAGNSLWMTIGSVVSLVFAFLAYGCSCCAVGNTVGRKRSVGGRGKVDPYGDKHLDRDMEDGAGAGTGANHHSPYILNQSIYHTAQTPNVQHLNQPYAPDGMAGGTGHYSPVVSPQGFEHQPRNINMGSPGAASGQQQGYQTPVLQHAGHTGQN